MNRARLLSLLFAGALCAPVLAAAAPQAGDAPLPADSVFQLDAQLVDHGGRRLPWAALRGRPLLVSMFYTSCAYICPLIVDSGKAIEKQLGAEERARLGIVLISLDPGRDTPAALDKVMRQRKLDPTRWTLASPRPEDVRAFAGVLGIRYRALADGEFNHTSVLVLLDADGRIVARSAQVGSRPDPEFVAAVRAAVAASALVDVSVGKIASQGNR